MTNLVIGYPVDANKRLLADLIDSNGNLFTIKAASTAASATDTSVVVALNPNSPLPAGTAVIGHVITDSSSVTNATLSAETTKVIGTVRTADGSGNLLTSTANALDVNIKSGSGITGLSTNVAQWGGTSTTLGQKVSASSVPVVIASDQSAINTTSAQAAATTGNITTASGAGSTVTATVTQYSVATITLKGTYTGVTVAFKASDDSGVTYYAIEASNAASPNSAATSFALADNSSNMFNVTVPGVTNVEVVCTAITGGTVVTRITPTADPMVFNVAAGLVAGTNIAGKFGIDQTTPGTTNLVSLSAETTKVIGTVNQGTSPWVGNTTQLGGTAIDTNSGNKSGGTQRVILATDSVALTTAGLFSVKVDQTTVGTTNAVSIAQIGANTVVTGGANGSISIGGTVAQNVAITQNPVIVGGSGVSAEPTVVTTGRSMQWVGDLYGKQIVSPYAGRDNWVKGTATTTGTSDTSVVASAGGSLRNYMTDLSIANTGATTSLITIKDGSAGATLWYTIAPAGGGSNKTFNSPVRGTAATAIYFAAGSSSTTIYCAISAFTGA